MVPEHIERFELTVRVGQLGEFLKASHPSLGTRFRTFSSGSVRLDPTGWHLHVRGVSTHHRS